MIYFLNILVLLLFSFLTLSFFPNLKILGVAPLLPVFFIISIAYFRKKFEPFALASLAGIFFDLFSPYPFGFYLVLFLLSVVLVRFFFTEGMKTLSFWPYLSLSLSIVAFYYVSQVTILYFSGVSIDFNYVKSILAGILVNGAFVLFLYVFSNWYFEKMIILEDKLKRR